MFIYITKKCTIEIESFQDVVNHIKQKFACSLNF